jgi:hypothetical protein
LNNVKEKGERRKKKGERKIQDEKNGDISFCPYALVPLCP